MPTRLLVALHPGFTDTPAVKRVHALANMVDLDIVLYSAVYDEHVAGLRFGDAESLADVRKALVSSERRKLDEVRRFLGSVSRSVRIEVTWHFPAAEGIVDAAKRSDVDIIVASSKRHSGAARLVLHNTDWELLRLSEVPVLFAHHRPFSPYRTVLAAVDPTHSGDAASRHDDRLIELSTWFSAAFGGEVHLGHSYPSARMLASGYDLPADVLENWRKQHALAVSRLATRHLIDDSRIHLVDDPPRIAIPHLAGFTAADLVVLGAGSRSFLERLVIGRTTEHVLDHLACDVVVVPTSGDAVT